tara:strand:- start:2210 stop:2731 length:522 start_codon:yes stop_codon:yes gene_type:complete
MDKKLRFSNFIYEEGKDMNLKSLKDFNRLLDEDLDFFYFNKSPFLSGGAYLNLIFVKTRYLDEAKIENVSLGDSYVNKLSRQISINYDDSLFFSLYKFRSEYENLFFVKDIIYIPEVRKNMVLSELDDILEDKLYVSDSKLMNKIKNSFEEGIFPIGRKISSRKFRKEIFKKL